MNENIMFSRELVHEVQVLTKLLLMVSPCGKKKLRDFVRKTKIDTALYIYNDKRRLKLVQRHWNQSEKICQTLKLKLWTIGTS